MQFSLAIFVSMLLPSIHAMGNGACGARKLSYEEAEEAADMVSRYENRIHTNKPFNVPVYWHSVRVGKEGDTNDQIEKSIKVLNDSFGNKFNFILKEKSVSKDKKDWDIDYMDDKNLKSKRKGNCNALNVYSTKLSGGLLGYANYPQSCKNSKQDDGVVIGYGTVPDGGSAPYDEGDTLTHEVGHWLFLAHTFDNGCNNGGDGVADTPAVANPNFGCPNNVDSCPGGGKDLVENFMDYTDDSCMNSFTTGQLTRAMAAWEDYRAQDGEPVSRPVSEPVSEPVAEPASQPVAQPSSVDCTELSKKECKQEDSCGYSGKKKIFDFCAPKKKYSKVDCETRTQNRCETKVGDNKAGVCQLIGNKCLHKCDGEEEKSCKKVKGDFNQKKICKAKKIANPCFRCQPISTVCDNN